MEEPGGLQSMGSLRVGHDWVTSLSLSCIGEGNGNPLQCSCLENPRDGGAWWATIYGVTQSRTRLKRLSSSSSSSFLESACNAGVLSLILVSGMFPGWGNGSPLQYSCLENHMDKGACQVTVHGVTESDTTKHEQALIQFMRAKQSLHDLMTSLKPPHYK